MTVGEKNQLETKKKHTCTHRKKTRDGLYIIVQQFRQKVSRSGTHTKKEELERETDRQ